MDILIKNMRMPQKGDVLKLYLCSDGCVGYQDREGLHKSQAIALSEHGRLKDADALIEKTRMWSLVRGDEYFELRVNNAIVKELLDAVPTIVEASNGTDN